MHRLPSPLAALAAVLAIALLPASAGAAEDRGDLRLIWGSLTAKENEGGSVKPANRPAVRALKRSGGLEAVVEEVNRRWALPANIPVLVSDSLDLGTLSPAYLPKVDEGLAGDVGLINFPGGFVELELRDFRQALRGANVRGLSPKVAMVATSQYFLAHEIGHALVHQLDIPITGREEDAVDGFAAYLLADDPRFGPLTALGPAIFYQRLTRQRGKLNRHHLSEEHSTHEQRAYQFLCWIYGSDPRRFKGLVGRGGLPRERAVRCSGEWDRLNRSWTQLLEDHGRTP